jgi:Protein of unknown function (DUF2971)
MSVTRFKFVDQNSYPHLYHWQKFDPEHLEPLLRDNRIWFSRPDTFNDPWDCKPCFATDFVNDPEEIERYIQDYADITRRQRSDIPESIIAQRQSEFRANPALLAQKVAEITRGMWPEIAERYRVYCLGPDPGNLLMWSHYADNHRGICLEFTTSNIVMCCATQVEYCSKFPMLRLYSKGEDDNLVPLLTKASVWSYEREYRLVAQERTNSTAHDTLMTDKNYLELPPNSLTSIIVGCQGQLDQVQALVRKLSPDLQVRAAVRQRDRYALTIP